MSDSEDTDQRHRAARRQTPSSPLSTPDASNEESTSDPDELQLRSSLRELSAKIQLKKFQDDFSRTRSGEARPQQAGEVHHAPRRLLSRTHLQREDVPKEGRKPVFMQIDLKDAAPRSPSPLGHLHHHEDDDMHYHHGHLQEIPQPVQDRARPQPTGSHSYRGSRGLPEDQPILPSTARERAGGGLLPEHAPLIGARLHHFLETPRHTRRHRKSRHLHHHSHSGPGLPKTKVVPHLNPGTGQDKRAPHHSPGTVKGHSQRPHLQTRLSESSWKERFAPPVRPAMNDNDGSVGVSDDSDDDWDDVEIEEDYAGGDRYVFYLQTEEGAVIGPLKFDVEEIEMGLPTSSDDAGVAAASAGPDGLRNRQTGSHGLNEFSSRSHSVLTVTIDTETQPDTDDESLYVTKRGKLSFVDLAGSEKVKDASGGSGGPGMLESNSINKSLLVLGNCISHLGDAKRRQGYIPYRDSKLTKLLSDSLGGNGITLMIACITPSSANVTETMNTLRYASRAKKIKSKPTVKMDPREKLIVNLKREIKVLRNENHYLRQQLDFPAKPKGQLQKENDEKFMKLMKEQKEKESGLYEMLQEYMVENENLRAENSEMHSMRDRIRREQQLLYRENEKLMKRMEEMERVMSQNPALWSKHQPPQRTDGYGHYDLVSPRTSPVALPPPPGLHSGHKQHAANPAAFGSPPGSRGKGNNPHGSFKPPHRLPDPVMRPAQRPVELVENGGAVYPANNGYASPRAGPPRQASPARMVERKASQLSTTDAINTMNEQLKREVMQLEGQIRHHQYAHGDRTSDLARSNGSNSVR